MSKRVIFLDIDGTLVHKHGEISLKVKEAINKVRENGHYVFLCTGRNRLGVSQLMDLGCFDGTVCSAGGYIEINGEKIYEAGMSDEEVNLTREVFDKYHILYNMEANFGAYQSREMTRRMMSIFGGVHNSEIDRLEEEFAKDLGIHSFEDYLDNPQKIQTIVYIADNKEDVLKAREELSDKLHFLIYSNINDTIVNGELMKKGVNKGTGIIKVLEKLNISVDDSIGFGDSMNDLEMIETCGYSVVMDNGDEKLKRIADYVCESVENDGIYHELKRLELF